MASLNWLELEKPLSDSIHDVIRIFGFTKMTPVQAATIPQLMSYKDVSVEAVTGSGKTLCFLIPMLEILIRRNKENAWQRNEIGAIIISPTRELATQTSQVLAKFLEHDKLNYFNQKLLVGGSNTEEDVNTIKNNAFTILICTPGRLHDLLERSTLKLAGRLKSLEFLVLDEADRLLDLGFKQIINSILSYLPRQRRTGLFSATQTKEVTDLIRAGLRNPVLVSVKEKSSISTPVALENYYTITEPDRKLCILLNFLKDMERKNKIMIFFSTCACVEYWSAILPNLLEGIKFLALHGKMHNKRQKIIDDFRNQEDAILLCTDVLARGLDIPELSWVIQWDPPSCATSFVHRVGRTARQGISGNALVMLLPSEDAYVNFLKLNQKVVLNELQTDDNDINLQNIIETIHKLQLSDRSVYDKSMRAFVSYIRAYSKHECSAILRVKDLNLGKIATCYGLMHLPKMPEIKQSNTTDFIGPKCEIDFHSIQYKNKQKELARKQKLEIFKNTGAWPGHKKFKKKTESWELTKQTRSTAKEKKLKRKANKMLKKKSENVQVPTRKRKVGISKEDLEELANDIRLFKKYKKKKISEEEFQKEIGLCDL